LRKRHEWLDKVLSPGRTRAGIIFQSSVFQHDFFNDTVKAKDKQYSRKFEAITETPPDLELETLKAEGLLVWLADMLDFEYLRLSLSIVHLITVFEAYLLDTVREILAACPQALKSGRQMTYREVFSFEEIGDLKAYAIEREVEQLGYKSYRQMAEYYAERFSIDFSKLKFIGETYLDEEQVLALIDSGSLVNGTIDQDTVVEIFATRNILVHNQGYVNQSYRYMVPNSPLEIGMLRPLSDAYYQNAMGILVVLADAIEDEVLEKFFKSDQKCEDDRVSQ
jgi:hypothetical protein